MFVSYVFKSEYLKYDKLAKTYYVFVDPEVLKVFAQITKLIRINNIYNINSITVNIILISILGLLYFTINGLRKRF